MNTLPYAARSRFDRFCAKLRWIRDNLTLFILATNPAPTPV